MEDPTVEMVYENTKKTVQMMTISFILFTQVCGFIACHAQILLSVIECITSDCPKESFHQIYCST